MLVTIVIITAFQAWWLVKNYREEKALFTTRTNALFRETVFRLQASRLKMDSNINIRVQDRGGIIGMTNVLQKEIRDSLGPKAKIKSAVVISFNGARHLYGEDDSLRVQYKIRNAGPDARVVDFLTGVDSLREQITPKDITDRYRLTLEKEKIPVAFNITTVPTDTTIKLKRRMELLPDDMEGNKVSVGFLHPITYQLNFENNTWWLLRRIAQPIFISLLLLAVTLASFLLLYRNLRQQQRLAQIKNDFIGNITHELKTPIATVSVAIEALRNFNALDDPRRTSEYLDISAHELQRLGLLVDKVLKLSMFENKQIALNKEPFDLVQLAREVMGSMRLQFEKQHATVALEQTGKDFVIAADKLHMTSVLYNLLDNALKYSRENPRITVHVIDHTQFIELQVMDNGIGIAREYKAKIFEQFFRVPAGNRHNIKGYGLGLSYVSHIVQRHMGFIEVESELDKGSTFKVKLPFKEAQVIYYDRGRAIRKTIMLKRNP